MSLMVKGSWLHTQIVLKLRNYIITNSLQKQYLVKNEAGRPLVDSDGNIMTEEQSITVSKDYQKLIADVMAGNTGSGKIKNEGETYIVSYTSIPLKGESDSWSVITLYRESTVMKPVYRMIAVAAAVALVIIAIAILVIALLARRLTKPIVSITELIGNASDGDFTVQAEESIRNEIGVLSKSFNKMTAKISAILTKMITITGEVVDSAEHLKQIEDHMDATSQAVREILDGSATQDMDVKQVVKQEEALGDKFGQLQEKANCFWWTHRTQLLLVKWNTKRCGT